MGGYLMDYDKLIERWRNLANRWENGEQLLLNGAMRIEDELRTAATALSTLQAENSQLRADLEYEREHANAYHEECGQWEAENENLRAELERMKRIMRDNGIMTIPSKYPGGPTEWNIPKPRGRKED